MAIRCPAMNQTDGPRRERSRSRAYRENILPYWKNPASDIIYNPRLKSCWIQFSVWMPRCVKSVSQGVLPIDCSWYCFSYSIVTKGTEKDCTQWGVLASKISSSTTTTTLFTKPYYSVNKWIVNALQGHQEGKRMVDICDLG